MLQTAGAGFGGGVDIYELLGHPDRLHQTNKGIMDHMLRQVRGQLATAEAALVDRELYRVPDYPGLSLPTGGFAGMQSTASELRALFVCALVPLTAAHGQAAAIAFIRSMAGAKASFALLRCLSQNATRAFTRTCPSYLLHHRQAAAYATHLCEYTVVQCWAFLHVCETPASMVWPNPHTVCCFKSTAAVELAAGWGY